MLKPSFPMGLVGLAVLLAMSIAVQVVRAKEYPVHVRFKNYDNDDDRYRDVQTYWEDKDLLKETCFGGVAVG